MRAVLILAAVVLLMVLLGWITFSREGDRPAVTINTDTVQQDTERAVEASREAAAKAAEGAERLADEVQRTDVDVDVRRESERNDP